MALKFKVQVQACALRFSFCCIVLAGFRPNYTFKFNQLLIESSPYVGNSNIVR